MERSFQIFLIRGGRTMVYQEKGLILGETTHWLIWEICFMFHLPKRFEDFVPVVPQARSELLILSRKTEPDYEEDVGRQ